MSASASFTYEIDDLNNSIRRTNTLLRAANAIRHMVNDIQELWRKPTLAKFMWTLINISRAYAALRRLHRLTLAEAQDAGTLMGLMKRIIYVPPDAPPGPPPPFDLRMLSVRVDAFRENLPMGLEGIDISDWPEEHRTMIQAIIEDEAQVTADNARELLHRRILHPEQSTGFLESNIHWQPQVDGARVVADAPYAWWVERGHDSFMGHWYLHDAVELAKIRLPDRIKNEIRGFILGEP